MADFSAGQRMQCLVPLLNAAALPTINQDMCGSITKPMVYRAFIAAPIISTQLYFVVCETEFKTQFFNHLSSFKDQQKMNVTELFKSCVGRLHKYDVANGARTLRALELYKIITVYKNRGIEPHISRSIVGKAAAFKSDAKRCILCRAEKAAILQADQLTLLKIFFSLSPRADTAQNLS